MATKQTDAVTGSEPGKFERLRDYFTEARAELRKVSWPTIKETRMTSIAVVILVIVMAIFLGLVDLGFTRLIALVLSPGA